MPRSTASPRARKPAAPKAGARRAKPAAPPRADGSERAADSALTTLDLAHRALDAIEDKKGSQIVLLDVHAVSMFTDYFLLCNGESDRQLKAMVDGVEEALATAGRKRLGLEGTVESGWVLLDYGDLMIHIFTLERRAYYRLDELWKAGQTIVKMQ
jgi:ribosome-associated protein